jgi:hypothetical protein
MAEEETKKDGGKDKRSILAQVISEVQESERKEVKSGLKALLEDRKKAVQTLDAITEKIVEKLMSVGESESEIRSLLKG